MTFHWLIFRNECILSVIEKKLENSKYILGTDPYKHIYRDVCPKYIFVITSILLFVNLFVVLYRSSDSKLITFLIIISIIIIIYYKLIYKHEPKQDLEK
jgi:amino acid permease